MVQEGKKPKLKAVKLYQPPPRRNIVARKKYDSDFDDDEDWMNTVGKAERSIIKNLTYYSWNQLILFIICGIIINVFAFCSIPGLDEVGNGVRRMEQIHGHDDELHRNYKNSSFIQI